MTDTTCLSSAAVILSIQDLNMQGKQGISLPKIFIIGKKKTLVKSRMTKAQKAQVPKELSGAQGFGAHLK